MAVTLNKLQPVSLAKLSPGRHSDGGGLYLVVEPAGSKRWAFIYRWKQPGAKGAGKLREMGLGSFLKVSLQKARAEAGKAREQLGSGVDPIEARRAESEIPTFGALADALVKKRHGEMRSEKSRLRIKRALEVYAADLRDLRVDAIGTDQVLKVLRPIWTEKPETATKVRSYIEAVLDAGKARGFRSGENPARWKGHLDHFLDRQSALSRGHHAALPYTDAPAFMAELRAREAVAARALEFVILTAARAGEVIGATWAEMDLAAKVWTIPAERMKSGREHRVPLSARALEILTEVRDLKRKGDAVFPGRAASSTLSNMAFSMLLRRMKREDLTTHGFRSTFRDWCGEATNFPREIAEQALAHAVGDDVERAYRRGDALEKRRKLMDAWAGYCAPKAAGGNVRELHGRPAA